MSYSIFYDKAFVKLSDGRYLPFVLSGCNNVYSCHGNGTRRARDWQMFLPNLGGTRIGTEEQLLSAMEDWRRERIETNEENNKYRIETGRPEWCDDYTDKRFGYYAGVAVYGKTTHTTTYNDLVNFVKQGIKYAITIEQMKALGKGIYLEVSRWCDNAKKHNVTDKVFVKDEQHFLQEFDRFHSMYTLDGINFYVCITAGEYEDLSKSVKRNYFPESWVKRLPAPPKPQVEVDHFYTIMFGENFFYKSSRRAVWYDQMRPRLKFKTEKQALSKLNKIADNRCSVKRMDYPTVL